MLNAMSDVQSFKHRLEQALNRRSKLQQSSVDIVPADPENAKSANLVPPSAEPAPPSTTKKPTEEQYRTTLLSKVREYYRQQQMDDNQSSETTI